MSRWRFVSLTLCCLGLLWLSGCASGNENEGCLRSSDCAQGQVCEQGACLLPGCQSDFDCAVGQVCVNQRCQLLDGANNSANNEDICQNDFDCPVGQICQDQRCQSPASNNDAPDLGAPDSSEPEDMTQGPDAATDMDAPDADTPDTGQPDTGQPDAGQDMGAPDVDEPDTDEPDAGPECAQDSDCSADRHCVANACVEGCHADEGCLLGQVCDVASHSCQAPGCQSDAACQEGQRCNQDTGQCEGPFVTCAGVECALGQWCDDFTRGCIGELPAQTCQVAADCDQGTACAPVTGQDGQLVLACRPEQGPSPASEPCQGAADCASGLCVRGACFSPCEANEACQEGAQLCLAEQVTPNDNATPEDAEDDPVYTVRSCTPVELCQSDADCADGQSCRAQITEGEVVGVCEESVGDLPGGAACESDQQCATGVCFQLSTGPRVCLAPCTQDQGCQPENTTCQEIRFTLGDGGTPEDPEDDPVATGMACLWEPSGEPLCDSDADCADGEVCAVDVNFQGPGLRNACRAAWGQVGPGGLCTHANECASGLCLDNERCYGPCTEDAACLEGSQCRQVPQEEGEDLQFCVSPPRQCSSDLDCEDGTLCLPALSEQEPDTIEGFCQVPTNPGGLLAGQGCTEDAQCASGACLGAGYCYGVCDAEANQGCNGGTRCYADTYRFTFDQGTEDLTDDRWDSTSSCGRNIGSFDLCQEDAQCPGTEICFPFTNRRYTGWETRCVLPFNVSGGTRGASCLSNSDCASNICLDFGFFTTMCLTVCNSDGDCAGFFTTCEAQEFIVDDRGTVTEEDDIVDTINICVP